MFSRSLGLLLVALSFVVLPLVSADGSQGVNTCRHPSQRKEWRALSRQEQSEWISAVKCLANLPHDPGMTPMSDPTTIPIPPLNTSGSYYDDFVYMHMDLTLHIHTTGLFLPWHRWYVYVYETALKNRCGYRGYSPYWDWTKDAPHFQHATIFDSDPRSGLGGWGDPNDIFQVPDGGFSKASSFKLSYPTPHSLRRNLTLQPFLNFAFPEYLKDPALQMNATFTKAEVDKLVNGYVGDFKGFQTYFEQVEGAHGSVHNIMGGDLAGICTPDAPADKCVSGAPTFSANEPLFWLHHAMVDKVWYDWQHKNRNNTRAFVGGSVSKFFPYSDYVMYPNGGPPWLTLDSEMPADGLFPQATIGDVLSTTDGILCYEYV